MPFVIGGLRQHRIRQLVKRVTWARGDADIAEPLRLLMFQAFDGELRVRHAEYGIYFAGVDLDGVVFVGAS